MRALSIQQPWAWLIVSGAELGLDKDVENRSRDMRYRGRFLVHASSKASLETYHEARMFVQRTFGVEAAIRMPHFHDARFRHGGIIGAATLADVRSPSEPPASKWHLPGHFGWMLKDKLALPFYPAKGQLGFWGDFQIVDGLVKRA